MTLPHALPLAPRPHPDEAISSWVRRMAARYDVSGSTLSAFVLGLPVGQDGDFTALDHRGDLALETALAAAAKVDRSRIGGLRVVAEDGSSSCWHRQAAAWCPDCLRADVDRCGEVHERAVWRLGCCVICPVHVRQLEHVCPRCERHSPCQYQPLSGLLRLVCGSCDRPVDSWSPSRPWLDARIGGFGILQTPALTQMIMALQADLLAALGGAAIPTGQWGCKRSGRQLLAIAMDLTIATVLSAELSIEPRFDPASRMRHWSPSSSHERITLAALPPYTASGLMALIAALLQDLGGRVVTVHQWRPENVTMPLDAASILGWLNKVGRSYLSVMALGWDARTQRALASGITRDRLRAA